VCQLDSMHKYREGTPCNCLGHPIQSNLDDVSGDTSLPSNDPVHQISDDVTCRTFIDDRIFNN
jgi:hypothetical protein